MQVDLDKLASQHVAPALLQREAALFETKWFDYRLLHPVAATSLFMGAYTEMYKTFSMKRIDLTEGANKTGLRTGSLFDQAKATITGLWKARQSCDERGLPYPFFCDAALGHATDAGWEFLPRPTQLYEAEMVERIFNVWEQQKINMPTFATADFFKAENFNGHFDQVQYQNWLCDRAESRARPEFLLFGLLKRGQVVEDIAVKRFGRALVERAKTQPFDFIFEGQNS